MAAKKSKYPQHSICGTYEYDLVVIGGGSGGLAASQQAVKSNPNAKVAVFDYVVPSPNGTTWGLGGTCVNVGCIPKKIMHYAGLLGHTLTDMRGLGWDVPSSSDAKHDWPTLQHSVGDYIQQLNFGYKKQLKEARVEYINALAKFVDAHTIEYQEKGQAKKITTDRVIIAIGGRPKYPDIPGSTLGISSDDIFWREKPPGKTLVIGASYIALECAGFIHHLGYDTTVMVRSILLRGFDQQSANQVGEIMEREGVRFIGTTIPDKIEQVENKEGGDPRLKVTWHTVGSTETQSEEFDTVLWAVGRDACVAGIGLEKIGVRIDAGKIVVDDLERTSVPNIYAIGDVIKDRPELTPVAIAAGRLLARRLFEHHFTTKMDFLYVPTTVFTPIEYGACGYSEEAARSVIGDANLVVYASRFGVLEGASVFHESYPKARSSVFTGRDLFMRQYALKNGMDWEEVEPDSFEEEERTRKFMKQPCLAKLVCDRSRNERVIGFHYVGPNAGEITQGFALALKVGAHKHDFDSVVGIHPTAAEEFTTMEEQTTKGQDFLKKGGC